VTLRVTDQSGLTDTQTYTVPVWSEPPSADFEWSPPSPYEDEEVEFDGSSSYEYDGCDSIAVYEWDFDNDGIYDDTGMYAYHTFLVADDYPVTLRVTDQSGLTDTETYIVTVYSLPP
jgi:PKD repeat protein